MSDVQVGDEILIKEEDGFNPFLGVTQGQTYEITEINKIGHISEIVITNDLGNSQIWTGFIERQKWKNEDNNVELISNNNDNNTMSDIQVGDENDMDTNFQKDDYVRIIDESYYADDVHEGDLFRVVSNHKIEPVSSKTTVEYQRFDSEGDTIELVHRVERDPFDDVTLNGHDVTYNEETDTLEVGCNSLDAEAVLDIVETLNDVRG